MARANGLFLDAKVEIEKKEKEIGGIVTKAREASAGAGAAVFTQDFNEESKELGKRAGKWLWAAAGGAALTAGFATLMFFQAAGGLDQGQIIQRVGSRFAILGVLFSATLWCGRICRALMHQVSVNRHRALSLQTFQAFSHAASDEGTKNAVLMEATRTVFGNVPTGFIKTSGSERVRDIRIVEVAKSVVPFGKVDE